LKPKSWVLFYHVFQTGFGYFFTVKIKGKKVTIHLFLSKEAKRKKCENRTNRKSTKHKNIMGKQNKDVTVRISYVWGGQTYTDFLEPDEIVLSREYLDSVREVQVLEGGELTAIYPTLREWAKDANKRVRAIESPALQP
jgi:hypothetical protein